MSVAGPNINIDWIFMQVKTFETISHLWSVKKYLHIEMNVQSRDTILFSLIMAMKIQQTRKLLFSIESHSKYHSFQYIWAGSVSWPSSRRVSLWRHLRKIEKNHSNYFVTQVWISEITDRDKQPTPVSTLQTLINTCWLTHDFTGAAATKCLSVTTPTRPPRLC